MKFPLETVTSYQNQALTQLVRQAMPKTPQSNDEPLSGDSKDFWRNCRCRPVWPVSRAACRIT